MLEKDAQPAVSASLSRERPHGHGNRPQARSLRRCWSFDREGTLQHSFEDQALLDVANNVSDSPSLSKSNILTIFTKDQALLVGEGVDSLQRRSGVADRGREGVFDPLAGRRFIPSKCTEGSSAPRSENQTLLVGNGYVWPARGKSICTVKAY